MSAVSRVIAIAVLSALAFLFSAARPSASLSLDAPACGRQAIVVLAADPSLYFCPLCGERFLADFRRFAARYGRENVWVVVSSRPGDDADGAPPEAAAKRLRMFLKSKGCPAPVLVDTSGLFLAAGIGTANPGLVLDAVSGSVEKIPPRSSKQTEKRP
ncbi:MAG: hypothetical protein JW747_02210 [Candidatus Aminicenantes bacterium]|nr:hypothetical protein [Candidatus Aminicenantes bacterium]